MPLIKQISRRTLLAGVALLPLASACSATKKSSATPATSAVTQDAPLVTVYKSPT